MLSKVNTLSTKESCWGNIRLAQIVAVPSGRLDKVSLYLESTFTENSSAYVVCEVYAMNGFGFPVGGVAASDSISLSSLVIPGYVNFNIGCTIGNSAIVSLRVQDGDSANFISWRFARASSGGEELLTSSNAGNTWNQDPTKKFAYIAYSSKQNAINIDDQSAVIQPGTLVSAIDDSNQNWTATSATRERTAVAGDTVVIDFNDISVTLIVDQSGSMTWNDNGRVRIDFLKDLINSLDSSLATYSPSSVVSYSIVKFGGRKIGKIGITVDGSDKLGFDFQGVKVIRKASTPPVSSTDGITIYEGNVQHTTDKSNLTPGTRYYYGIFSINADGLPSLARIDSAVPELDSAAPTGVANFSANISTVLSSGNDLGARVGHLTWSNPAGFDYNNIYLVRRTDRSPESIVDGNVLLTGTSATVSYTDNGLLTGVTYYYAIFTEKTNGIKCSKSNARKASPQSPVLDRGWESTQVGTPPVGLDITSPNSPILSVLEGNATNQLDWSASDSDTKLFKLWFRPDGYPRQTDAHGRDFDGSLLYVGEGTEFIHRSLANDQEYFYLLTAIDSVGNYSVPTTFKAKPHASSIVSIPPEQVSSFETIVLDDEAVALSWVNPTVEHTDVHIFFNQTARIVSSVEFADDGDIGTFISFEFVKISSSVVEFVDPAILGISPINPEEAIFLSNAPSLGTSTIAATASMTPNSNLLNRIKTATLSVASSIRVKNKKTGAVIATVNSKVIHITFDNPFELSIKNEPAQNVSIRNWQEVPDASDSCKIYGYNATSSPGVYAGTNESFHALIEAKFDGVSLTEDASVTLALLDPVTRKLSNLVKLSEGVSVYNITTKTDEILDRNGTPTGSVKTRSLLSFDLPPSNIPGNFILQATSTYRDYVQTAEIIVHYEPSLNMDLFLRSFDLDGVDIAEQKAFVYYGPFDAPQSEKRPVEDFVITNWTIRPTCQKPKQRPLYGGDVPGLGVRAYTRGGLAQGILWGPGNSANSEEEFEVHVTAQVGGVKVEGYGMLSLGYAPPLDINRILLRSPTGFSTDVIQADGISESVWEVLAKPETEPDTGTETGGYFVNAVVGSGGKVPSLPDGAIITLTARAMSFSSANGTPTPNSFKAANIMKNLLIKTNLTGTNGVSGTANAIVEEVNGVHKAIFKISVNGAVPLPDDNDVTGNDFSINEIYGIQFERPKTGIVLSLTAGTVVESNGKPINFKGGGSNLINDAPPCFLGLVEPLQPS